MLLPAVAIDDRQLPSFVVAYGTDMARSITAADWVSQRSNRAREPQAVALAVILRNTDQAGSARQYRGRLHAKDTLTDLMTEGARLGLTKLGKKGEHVLRTAVPTTVELFDLSVAALGPAKGQWLYRMYSGYAHAKQWAVTMGAQQMTPSDSSGRSLALTQGQDLPTAYSTLESVDAFERAVDAYEELRP